MNLSIINSLIKALHHNIYKTKLQVIIVFVFLLILTNPATAQDAKKIAAENAAAMENMDLSKMPNGWRKKANIMFGFVATNNYKWNGAAEKYNITATINTTLKAEKKFGLQLWTNEANALLGGVVSTNTLGSFRKGQDLLQMSTSIASQLIPKWFAASRTSLQSQLMPTYKYTDSNTIDRMTSTFLSPGVIRSGIGFLYKKTPLKIYFSPVTVNVNTKLDKKFLKETKGFGVDSGKAARLGFGALLSIEYFTLLPKGISYKTKLDLFTDYTKMPLKVIDTDWTNNISMMLTKQISLSMILNFRYYHFIDPTVQFLQTTGLSGTFLF
jgi:Protein of unknown function (DUF3078)